MLGLITSGFGGLGGAGAVQLSFFLDAFYLINRSDCLSLTLVPKEPAGLAGFLAVIVRPDAEPLRA